MKGSIWDDMQIT